MHHQQAFAKGGNHRFAQAYTKANKRFMMKNTRMTSEQMAVKHAYVAKSKGLYNQMGMQDQTEQLMEMGMDESKSRMVSKQLNKKVMSKGKKAGGGGGGMMSMPPSMGMQAMAMPVANAMESEDEAEAATAIFASEGIQMQKLDSGELLESAPAKKISSGFASKGKKGKKKARMDDEYVGAMGGKNKNYHWGGGEEE